MPGGFGGFFFGALAGSFLVAVLVFEGLGRPVGDPALAGVLRPKNRLKAGLQRGDLRL